MRRLILLLLCCMSVAVAGAQGMKPELAAGFKAGFLCSGIFHAGRSVDQIMGEELAGIDYVATLPPAVVDMERKTVSVPYEEGKAPRLAVFIDTLGTVIMPVGAQPGDRPALPAFAMPMPTGDAESIPWPDGDLLPEGSAPARVDAEKLNAVVAGAFDTSLWPDTHTIGVVVVCDDRIVAEHYAPGWGRDTQYRTWSTGKSIANALVGILVKQGKLSVKQPAPVPEWQKPDDPRRAITIEDLLEMSSGLKSPGALTYSGYWGGIDSAADAARGEVTAAPGTRWMYANYDTLLLMKSAREVIADDAAYITFPRRELLNKIGMRHTFPETDAFGNYVISSQVYTTPRDLARFGLLYLHDGVWNGERILPEGWVKYSTTPAKALEVKGDKPRGYAKQWWLYNGDPRLPRDTYTTSGNRGQFCTIVPSRGVIVVRMGIDPMWQDKWSQPTFVAQVLEAIGE